MERSGMIAAPRFGWRGLQEGVLTVFRPRLRDRMHSVRVWLTALRLSSFYLRGITQALFGILRSLRASAPAGGGWAAAENVSGNGKAAVLFAGRKARNKGVAVLTLARVHTFYTPRGVIDHPTEHQQATIIGEVVVIAMREYKFIKNAMHPERETWRRI